MVRYKEWTENEWKKQPIVKAHVQKTFRKRGEPLLKTTTIKSGFSEAIYKEIQSRCLSVL